MLKIKFVIIIAVSCFILGAVGSGIVIYNQAVGESNRIISEIRQHSADLENQLTESTRREESLNRTIESSNDTIRGLKDTIKSSVSTIAKLSGILEDVSNGLQDFDGVNEEFRKLIKGSGSKN